MEYADKDQAKSGRISKAVIYSTHGRLDQLIHANKWDAICESDAHLLYGQTVLS